jgi:ribosomal protein L31
MKKGIHPENYRLVAFKDMSNEDVLSLNLLQIQEKHNS